MSDLFGVRGRELLSGSALAVESRARVDSLLRLVEAMDFEISTFDRLVAGRLRTDPGYRAIHAVPGIGPVLAALFVAEIGDVTRFDKPQQLASWAGLTPKHTSPTPSCIGDGSPSTDLAWSDGARSRRCNACQRIPGSGNAETGSPSVGAAT